uniref:Apolipophorins n=1 Tax=Cacopsylla melanoneura TaxID=428564 RepID=A0A8D9BZI6_9HEMI
MSPVEMLVQEDDLVNNAEEELERIRRSADSDAFFKKVDQVAGLDNYDLDVYVKILGSGVGWGHYHGDSKIKDTLDKATNIIQEEIEENKKEGKKFDFRKHFTFLDAELLYPTSLGLTLRLNAVGSSVVNLKFQASKPNTDEVSFTALPSAAVEVVGILSVDGYVAESGLKLTSTLHSSTGTEVSLKKLSKAGFELKVGVPVKKQDIINFKTEITSVVKEPGLAYVETPIKFNVKNAEYGGCFDQLMPLVGVTPCAVVSFPFDGQKFLNPIYGPAKLSLKVDKEDESLKTFLFKIHYDDKEQGLKKFELLLDTPESKTERKVQLLGELKCTDDKKEVKASFVSPIKTADFEGSLVKSASQVSLNSKFLSEGVEYSAKIGAEISGSGSHRTYKPFLEYKIPDIATNNKFITKKGGKNKAQPVITVEGEIILDELPGASGEKHNHQYTFKNLGIGTPNNKYVLNGNYKTGKFPDGESDLVISYEKQTLGLKHKIALKSPNENTFEDSVYFEVRSSQYPDFGIALDYGTTYIKSNVSNVITRKLSKHVKFTHGNNPQSETSRLSYQGTSKTDYNRETHDFDMTHDNEISYPLINLNAKGNVKVVMKKDSGNLINADINGKYDKAAFTSHLDAKFGQKKPGEYDVTFKNKFLANSLEAEFKRVIVSDEKQKFTNTLSFASDSAKAGNGKYSLNAEVTNNKKSDTVNKRIQASLFVPQEEKPLKVDAGYKWGSTEVKTHVDVTLGDDPYLSSSSQLVLSKTSPSGSFKLDLSDLLKSQASFKYVAGKEYGNDFTIQLLAPKLQRAVKGKTSFTIDGDKYKGFFEFLFDAEKDPSKKIRLDTDTLLQLTDSKKRFATDNQLTILSYVTKFKADAKADEKGDEQQKNKKHSWSFDLTFPSEAVFKGSYNGEANVKKHDGDYKFDLDLTREGKSTEYIAKLPKKLTLHVKVDKIDVGNATFNSDVNFKLDGESRDIVDVNANVHSLINGDKRVYGYEHKAKGSVIPENNVKFSTEQSTEYLDTDFKLTEKKSFPPFVTKLEFGVTKIGQGSFELAAKGKKLSYTVAGKIDESYSTNSIQEFKFSSDNTFDIHTPKSVLQSDNSLKWNKEKFIKVNLGLHGKEKGVSVNGEVETHSVSKRTFSGSLTAEVPNPKEDTAGKIDGNLSVKWENQEAGLSIKGETFKDKNGGKVSILANHPKTGKVEISGSNKILKDNKGVNAELTFIRNEKKVKLGLKTDLTKNKPEFDFTVDQDAGKSRVYVKYDKKDDNHLSGAVKLQWIANGGGSLDADVDADYRSLEDFNYKLNIDSPVLKINKVRLEVNNKPAKGEAQKIQYSVKVGGKVVIAGSSNFVYKDEGDKKVIEGSGSFKYEDKTYPITFKYVAKSLHKSTDGEVGELAKFNIVCDGLKLKLEGENKVTDEEFRVYRNYCDDGKCFVNEVSYKFKGSDVLDYEQELIVQLDFRPLLKFAELPETEPIKLKASTKRYGLALNQQLEIKWSPTDKIEYNVYLESTKAGVVVTLPKRTLALESTYDLKKDKGFLGEAYLWLDKVKAPEQKTGLLVKYDNSYDKDQRTVAASGEVRFSHPALPKDMSVSGRAELLKDWANVVDANVDIDVFQKKGQKIVIDLSVNREKRDKGQKVNTKFSVVSKDQNLNFVLGGHTILDNEKLEDHTTITYVDKNNKKRDGLLHFEYSKQKFVGRVLLFDLIQWKGIEELKINQKDTYLEYTSKHEINGNKFGEHLTINKKAVLDYVLKWKCHDKPERELGFKSEFNYNTKAEVQVTALKEGKKVEVALVTVKFDQENFLKTSEALSLDDIKEVVVTVKDDIRGLFKDHSDLLTKIGKELEEETNYRAAEFTKAKPNLKPAITAINNQLKEMKEEIANDKALKDAAEHVKRTFNDLLDTFVTLFEAFTHVLETVTSVSFDLVDKLVETIKTLTPAVVDAYTKITKYAIDAVDSVLKAGVATVNSFIDELKKHEGDFKGITTFGNDLFLGVGKVVAKWYAQVQKETAEFYRVLSEQLKSLPLYPMLKEKLDEIKNLQVPENVLSVVLEVLEGLKDSLPTPELKSFADSLIDYLKKVIESDQKINFDSEELKKLLNQFVEALKSVFPFLPSLKSSGTGVGELKPSVFLPIPLSALFKYPFKLGAVHVSTINNIINGELPFKISQASYTAFRGLMKPEELLPPYSATGVIVDKSYVITYNGKWLPLAGSCSYVLAQDLRNNNFSVSIKVQNGKFSSVVVTDKEDEVEVFVDKKVKLNAADSEYPVRSKNIHSWRQYGKVLILGLSGVFVECSDSFDLCSVTVNGYYQNKVYGLLGAHNLEPYLDFTLPGGKHTEDKSEFYNSYGVGGCASPAKITQITEKATECKDLFNENSTMVYGYMFVNMKTYLEACSNAVSKQSTPEQKSAKACLFASAYVTAVHKAGGIFLDVPIGHCEKYAVCPALSGELISEFKAPFTRADVVLVVEEDVKNEEVFKNLVVPLVPALTAELKKEGLTDVHFTLIGYGSTAWPQHYTKNGEFEFDGSNSKFSFVDASDKEATSTQLAAAQSPKDRIKWFLRYLNLLGDSSLTDALTQAAINPFRPGSAKAIVIVGATQPKRRPADSLSISFPLTLANARGAKIAYVGPIKASIKNNTADDIVGFNQDQVFLLNECKPGAIVGNEVLSDALEIDHKENFFADVFKPQAGAFNSEVFLKSNPEQKKIFTEIVANTLAKKLSKPTSEVCTCFQPNDTPAVPVCVPNAFSNTVDIFQTIKTIS